MQGGTLWWACRNARLVWRARVVHSPRRFRPPLVSLPLPLPPALQYYFMDVEGAMSAAGFRGVVCEELDPRHRIIIGHC